MLILNYNFESEFFNNTQLVSNTFSGHVSSIKICYAQLNFTKLFSSFMLNQRWRNDFESRGGETQATSSHLSFCSVSICELFRLLN